jgi:hypothetical protein
VAQPARRAQGNDAKQLKELKTQNARLKRIVADKELEIDALRGVAKGNFWTRRAGARPS